MADQRVCRLSFILTPNSPPIQNAKARLRVPGARADDLSECLLSLGAISVTVEDANAGTEAEQAIARGPANWLSMGSSSGEAMREQLWDASTLRFFFTPGEVGGEDGGASELVTMAAWTAVLVAAPQPVWVMELAIAAQSLLLVWIAIVLLTRDRFVTTLTWISGIAMLPYAAVAVGAKGPWVLLVLVYLHTAHRIIIDGWWIYAVRAEAAP